MRNSKRLTREALEAMDAETNRDRAAVHAQIDSDRELLEAIEAGRKEDLASVDSVAATQRTQVNRRADVLVESIQQRIAANEARIRDLDGGPAEKPKKVVDNTKTAATGTQG